MKHNRHTRILKNHKIDIMGEIREIPEIKVSIASDGAVSMSFDEYNRICDYVHYILKKKRRVVYK